MRLRDAEVEAIRTAILPGLARAARLLSAEFLDEERATGQAPEIDRKPAPDE